MKDKEMKFEDVKDPHRGTQGGSSYILFLYINSDKEVVNNWEVELYKPRSIKPVVDSAYWSRMGRHETWSDLSTREGVGEDSIFVYYNEEREGFRERK